MTDFKAKMHQIQFRLGLRPRLGSLQRSPRPTSWIWGRFAAGGRLGWGRGGKEERKGREGKWRGGKGRAPKLLLNQGPAFSYRQTWKLDGEMLPASAQREVFSPCKSSKSTLIKYLSAKKNLSARTQFRGF